MVNHTGVNIAATGRQEVLFPRRTSVILMTARFRG